MRSRYLVRRVGIALGAALSLVAAYGDAAACTPPLPEGVAVACGIHDSNASLFPHLLRRHAPFSVVSTGTWVIVLAIGGKTVELDPARDTLINVNAFGDPVPSARFMGGREFELLTNGKAADADAATLKSVLKRGIRILPAVVPDSGPFQGVPHEWSHDAVHLSAEERFCAASLYLALMSVTSLNLIAATGATIVEGPFSNNPVYVRALAALTGREVLTPEKSATGTSIGAALLFELQDRSATRGRVGYSAAEPYGDDIADMLRRYAAAWSEAAEQRRQNRS